MSLDLAIKAEIEDFINAYAHDIDDGNLDCWPEYFTNDGIYQIITRETFEEGLPLGIMLCEGKGMMADRVRAMKTASIYEVHSYCHLLGRTQISLNEDGHYQTRTNFNILRTMQDGDSVIFAIGKYIDKIVFYEGRPLLKERRVILESRRVDILLVYPL